MLRFMRQDLVSNLQAVMEYRTAFAMQVVSMAANDCLCLFFWWTFFRQFPLVHGGQSTDIVVIWGIASCGFGIGMGVFGNAPRLATLIMNGGLDAYPGRLRLVCAVATAETVHLALAGHAELISHPMENCVITVHVCYHR
ncbi:MAG: hypothetical protein NVS3B14_12940 [Ktedonobacteraceae bacterium]